MVWISIETNVKSKARCNCSNREENINKTSTKTLQINISEAATYFECIVLYSRIPSAMPQIWTRSSLDIRNKSAPLNCENVDTYWPRRCILSHWANNMGVASLDIFAGGAINVAPVFVKSSGSRIDCCNVDGDRILWSTILVFELVDETLFIPIGLATVVFVAAVKTPSSLRMWIGEFGIIGEPEPRTLKRKKHNTFYFCNFWFVQ